MNEASRKKRHSIGMCRMRGKIYLKPITVVFTTAVNIILFSGIKWKC